jgi:hypothetical protein
MFVRCYPNKLILKLKVGTGILNVETHVKSILGFAAVGMKRKTY